MDTPQDTPKSAEQEREERIARILKAVEERLRREFPAAPQTLDEIERTVEQIGEQVKREIQHEILDACGSGYQGRTIHCRCGAQARYKADYVRSVVTLHGEEPIARAYYYCSACRRGFHPIDRVLGVAAGQCSTHVRALACRFASYLPFALAARELELVCGIKLSASSVQRIAKQTGKQLAQEWSERQKRLWEQVWEQGWAEPEPTGPVPEQLHVSMDGVMVHVDGLWREVKLGVCYERANEKGPTKASYYATLAASCEFGQRLRTLAHRAAEPRCRKVAVVADGSDWIWQEAGKYFTQRVHILDFYHVCEHLYTLAGARFGEGRPEAAEWVHRQKGRLLEEQVGSVLVDIRAWQPSTQTGEEVQRKELAYLSKHARRMRYKSFREAGFHIGSGVMEASCRWVVQQRMKGSGMRWSSEGAESMLQLRTAWCSVGHEDLMAVTRRAAGLA